MLVAEPGRRRSGDRYRVHLRAFGDAGFDLVHGTALPAIDEVEGRQPAVVGGEATPAIAAAFDDRG